jgi:hypothetical protein
MSGFVQNGATAAVNSGVLAPTITGVTAGNTLICVYEIFSTATIAAPTDSNGGQTWTILVQNHGTQISLAIIYLLNANAGTHTLTFATQSNASVAGICEVNGITGTGGSPVSSDTGGGSPATTITASNYTPASSSEFVVACAVEAGSNTNDGFHCTTASFQGLGSLSDSGSESCWMVEQNGSLYVVGEANAQIITSSSTLACTWVWTPTNSAVSTIAGFAYTASLPPTFAPFRRTQFFVNDTVVQM